MCLQKSARIFLFLTALLVLAGCGALDAILPATGTYKINAKINNTPLDDFSIVTSKDKILPFFEEPVSEDPDITELVVFLKDSKGLPTGYKVTYSLIITDKDNNKEDETELQAGQSNSKTENKDDKKKDDTTADTNTSTDTVTGADKNKDTNNENTTDKKDEVVTGTDKNKETNKDDKETVAEETDPLEKYEYTKKGNEINFPVKSLDDVLPFLPLPADLPIGKYTLVFQVNGKNTILYKYEKPLFYLANAKFSFEGIQVNLPGIAESSQFIQNKNVILLEINLDFDSRLEPYVVWYNGKKIIDEGLYSGGAGKLLWEAPDQNGFVSLHAEVFPSSDRAGLTGSQKGISLLVSSKEVDMHLLSEDTPNLVQWYVFEGGLNNSLIKDSKDWVIETVGKTQINWLSSNGTYGLASGTDNIFKLPEISTASGEGENNNWQIILRFKPLNEGEIFSVQFGSSDVTMILSNKKSNLVLSLVSASSTYSESLRLPGDADSFVTVSVKFSIQAGRLSAKLVFVKPGFEKLDLINQRESIINPITVKTNLDKKFQIMLGQQPKKAADNIQPAAVQQHGDTAIWDEFAIMRISTVEILTIKKDPKEIKAEKTAAAEAELFETTAANYSNEDSNFPN